LTMISKPDLERLLQRPQGRGEVLSLFLDMSVSHENKRTYQVFLNQQRARFAELASERDNHHREPIGAALARVDEWIANEYDESNKGVALFVEIGGEWMEAIQLPIPIRSRMIIAERAAVGPLAEVLGDARRYGVILVDREHLRLFSVYLGSVVADEDVRTEPYPTSHSVKAGGFAAKDHQKRKAEEARQFFRDFAGHLEKFQHRNPSDRWILLGTDENRGAFREFMPHAIVEKVVHEGTAMMEITNPHLVDLVKPFIEEDAVRERAEAVDLVLERVRNRHFAIAGIGDTLEQLQEGKVERLVVARTLEEQGAQCTQCNFYLVSRDGGCPYCGGSLRNGVDLVESMLRMAAEQQVAIEFADAGPLRELHGVGALLRF
jgi:peptide subunit release factor 1 (eRF1)